MSNKPKILAIVGSTGSGKTALSIAMCKRLSGQVIICDSMQVYRGMDVGTAKPDEQEMDGVVHHLIDIADPREPFSSAAYVEHAKEAVERVAREGGLPVLCGGTGLYLDSLLRGGFSPVTEDPAFRAEMAAFAAEKGNGALHDRLREIDPESADAIHPNNVKRVIRALEIYHSSGLTKTEADRLSSAPDSPYDACVIGLRYNDRELLYRRIGLRVEDMMRRGLLDETRRLYEAGIFNTNSTAAGAIGYKELLGYLRGEQCLEEAVEDLKTATRRYAKRQITWFSSKSYVRWVDADREGRMRPLEEILSDAIAIAKEALG